MADKGSGNDNKNDQPQNKMTTTERAIVDMMKRQNLQVTEVVPGQPGEVPEKHAFWDTQVGVSLIVSNFIFILSSNVSISAYASWAA